MLGAVIKLIVPPPVAGGDNATVSCTAQPADTALWWAKDDVNVSLSERVTAVRETKVGSDAGLRAGPARISGLVRCGTPGWSGAGLRVGPVRDLAWSGAERWETLCGGFLIDVC